MSASGAGNDPRKPPEGGPGDSQSRRRVSYFSGRQTIRGAAPKARSNEDGGAERDRTDDLMLAKHALSQLSYSPKPLQEDGGPGRTRTSDLTLIRRAL